MALSTRRCCITPRLRRQLAYRLAVKLSSAEVSEQIVREIAQDAYSSDGSLSDAARADLAAVLDRDPACTTFTQPLLYFKGFQALQGYRIGNWLWGHGRRDLALLSADEDFRGFRGGHPPGGRHRQGASSLITPIRS